MKSFERKKVLLVLACLISLGIAFLPTSVLAETKYSLGAGVAAVPDYEGSEDYEAAPLLLFNAKWDDGYFVKFAGATLKANVVPNKMWSLGPVLQYRGKRDNDVNNEAVGNMKKIDSTVEGGLFVGFNDAGWDASLQWVTDLSDKHDGSLTKLAAGYSFKENKWSTRIGVSSTYADTDYMKTYFSVTSDNRGASGLPLYNADSGFKDVGVDLTVSYGFNETWALTGLFGYTALLNDAKDSPVVDDEGDSNQYMGGLAVVYNF